MARIKGGLNAKKKHNRVLKLAKGYRGARSKQYRVAKQSVMRALTSSYAGRKQRKRQFRQLWIARINAAARMNGLSYSKLMHGLKLADVEINRKMLSEMAISEPDAFAALVEVAKGKLAQLVPLTERDRISLAEKLSRDILQSEICVFYICFIFFIKVYKKFRIVRMCTFFNKLSEKEENIFGISERILKIKRKIGRFHEESYESTIKCYKNITKIFKKRLTYLLSML